MKNKKFESISKKDEISQIFSKGKVVSDSIYLLKYLPSKKFRLGLSVAKKNFKHSVTRNKIKRQIRNIIYSFESFPQVDLFVVVKNTYKTNKYPEMQKSLQTLSKKIK